MREPGAKRAVRTSVALKAALFDVDGTLVDSVDAHARCWLEAFEHFGFEADYEEVRRAIGMGGDKLKPKFLPTEFLAERGEEISEFRTNLFLREYAPHLQAFPGVHELMERLDAEGTCIALASSANKKELEALKKVLKIDEELDGETNADDAEESKPEPDIFIAAREKMGVEPEEAIVLGDTPYDIEAARKAGMRTIGIAGGPWTVDELRQHGAVEAYESIADLLNRYEKSALAPTRRGEGAELL